MVDHVEVLTAAPAEVLAEYEQEARLDGVVVRSAHSDAPVAFRYVHGLSIPQITPLKAMWPGKPLFNAEASVMLRFGMLECHTTVQAGICVYDPQSAFDADPFSINGSSTAERLAIVANRGELCSMGKARDPIDAAVAAVADGAEVVVVKSGSEGAVVVTASGQTVIPARLSSHVFPIGSGDVFAAAFTVGWAIDGMKPVDAAEFASYAVADYVETMSLPISPALRHTRPSRAPVIAKRGRVYLAGPFFSMGQRWLVEEARAGLQQLGMDVFSPFHDIGPGPAEDVAPADLEALDGCDSVLALLDGLDSGTLFEVGYARAKGIPVYGFAQITPEEDLKMVQGSGCRVFDDFVTCLHHCAWAV